MHNLFKVNSEQIFLLWRNTAISLLALMANHTIARILPVYMTPIVSTVIAAFMYFFIYSNSYSKSESCMAVPYTVFLILVSYTLALIAINLINIWTIWDLPAEMVFFDGIYIPNLIMAPTGLLVAVIVYLRRKRLSICVDCRLTNGSPLDRGRLGIIYSNESTLQMRNMMLIFSIFTVLAWGYYLFGYTDTNISNRDTYVFTWIAMMIYIMDIIYFGIRYYNLYLDLRERDELISPDEIDTVGVRTYVRFYVICSDCMYVTDHSTDNLRDDDDGDLLGTPFMTKRNMSVIALSELKEIVSRMTGVANGKLQFFFGRRRADAAERRVLRYFYFLPGNAEDYPSLALKGKWISSEKLKTIYNQMPDRLTTSFLADMSRLATILITMKTFNENGDRRMKLAHYKPTFTFQELQDSDVDFQDDTWIRVSMFNSDTKFFKFRRWLRSLWRRSSTQPSQPPLK